jgi:hypothetical protein
MNRILILPILILLLNFTSCEKQPGEGGTSSIKGKIFSIDYIDSKIDTFPAFDENVFIIYGNSGQFNDDIETSNDGTFQFEYLRKGNYKLFVYTRSWENEGYEYPLTFDVHINENKSEVDIGTIYLYKSKKGTGTVKGKVLVSDLRSSSLTEKARFLGRDEAVYIQKVGEDVYIERIRTNKDGIYVFSQLFPGKYCVYAYAENVVGDTEELIPVMDTVEITEYNQTLIAKDLLIIK